MILWLDELQIFGQQQMNPQLARRSHGDGARPSEFGIATPPASLSKANTSNGWTLSPATIVFPSEWPDPSMKKKDGKKEDFVPDSTPL
jgi:hypothetical protein